MKKRIAGATLAACLFMSNASSVQAATIEQNAPTQNEIVTYIKKHPMAMSKAQSYVKKPKGTSVGKTYNVAAVNTTNLVRLLTGLPAVSEEPIYSELAQNGAYILNQNDELNHRPSVPRGMNEDDIRYEKGSYATNSSNLAYNYSNIASSILYGYMYDGDSSNLDGVGHRKWMMDPTMQKVGFGQVGLYTTMYIADNPDAISFVFPKYKLADKQENEVDAESLYVWPSVNMPLQYMREDMPFSISYDRELYTMKNAKITMVNSRTKKKIVIDSKKLKSGQHFSTSKKGYGHREAIVWRPAEKDMKYKSGDRYDISISNILKDGSKTTISYKTQLFDLQKKLPEVTVAKTYTVKKGKKVNISLKKKYDYDRNDWWIDEKYDKSPNVQLTAIKKDTYTYKATKVGTDTFYLMSGDYSKTFKIKVVK